MDINILDGKRVLAITLARGGSKSVPKKNIREIKLLNLSKNLGHMIALREGLKLSKGVFTISLDCDLQDPPEFISRLVQEYMESSNYIDCIIG